MIGSLVAKARARLRYSLDMSGFRPKSPPPVTPAILQTAKQIRGTNQPPALFLHGLMPRSGSVYTGNLLKLHPDFYPYPDDLWEVPFLQQSDKIRAVQSGFIENYEPSEDKLQDSDFLCLFGSSLIAHLQRDMPPNKRMLLKMAGVHHLDDFFAAFPHEHLLVVIRDGRDVVRSTLNSWPSLDFASVCRRWNQSARLVMAFDKKNKERAGYRMVRFEDNLQNPVGFMKGVSAEYNLPLETYPFDAIKTLPIRGSSSVKVDGDLSWRAVSKPKTFDPVGGWQSWPRWKKTLFKRIAGETLIELGYADNNEW